MFDYAAAAPHMFHLIFYAVAEFNFAQATDAAAAPTLDNNSINLNF
jgi:hypothetical protein